MSDQPNAAPQVDQTAEFVERWQSASPAMQHVVGLFMVFYSLPGERDTAPLEMLNFMKGMPEFQGADAQAIIGHWIGLLVENGGES